MPQEAINVFHNQSMKKHKFLIVRRTLPFFELG
jgi:hypothetical protein